jgi:hypothetical protein
MVALGFGSFEKRVFSAAVSYKSVDREELNRVLEKPLGVNERTGKWLLFAVVSCAGSGGGVKEA